MNFIDLFLQVMLISMAVQNPTSSTPETNGLESKTEETASPKKNSDTVDIEIPSIPENPVASVLNLDPSKITSPSTPAAVAASLISAIDDEGKFKPGLAIEFAPFWLAIAPDTTLEEWRDDPLNQLLSRLTIGLVTASQDDGSMTIGGGAKLVIVDQTDTRHDKELTRCLKKAQDEINKQMGSMPKPGLSDEDEKKRKAISGPIKDACFEESRQRMVTGHTLALAIAATGESKENAKDFEPGEIHLWLAGNHSFGRSASGAFGVSLVYGLRYIVNETKDTRNFNAAFGLTLGFWSAELSIRGAWTPVWSDDGDDVRRLASGADLKVMFSSSLGVILSFGNIFGARDDEDAQTFTVNLILGKSTTGTVVEM